MSGRRQKAVVDTVQSFGAELRKLTHRIEEADRREQQRAATLTELEQRTAELEAAVKVLRRFMPL